MLSRTTMIKCATSSEVFDEISSALEYIEECMPTAGWIPDSLGHRRKPTGSHPVFEPFRKAIYLVLEPDGDNVNITYCFERYAKEHMFKKTDPIAVWDARHFISLCDACIDGGVSVEDYLDVCREEEFRESLAESAS